MQQLVKTGTRKVMQTIRGHRQIGKQSFADVLKSAKGMQARRLAAVEGQRIPCHIIDPTGSLIPVQRSIDAAKRRHAHDVRASRASGTNKQYDPDMRNQSCLARCCDPYGTSFRWWPTLYPAWDVITSIALIFTAFVTPFEVGFLPPAERWYEGEFLPKHLKIWTNLANR